MKPLRFEREWKGYRIAECRAGTCHHRGVVNFDGLCRQCNHDGYHQTSRRVSQPQMVRATKPNSGWRSFRYPSQVKG